MITPLILDSHQQNMFHCKTALPWFVQCIDSWYSSMFRGDQKVAGSISIWGSETFSEFALKSNNLSSKLYASHLMYINIINIFTNLHTSFPYIQENICSGNRWHVPHTSHYFDTYQFRRISELQKYSYHISNFYKMSFL